MASPREKDTGLEAARASALQQRAIDDIVTIFSGGVPGLAPQLTARSPAIDSITRAILLEKYNAGDIRNGLGAAGIRMAVARNLAEAGVKAVDEHQLNDANIITALKLVVAQNLKQGIEEALLGMSRTRQETIDGKPIAIRNLFGVMANNKFVDGLVTSLETHRGAIEAGGARMTPSAELRAVLMKAANDDPIKLLQTPIIDLIKGHVTPDVTGVRDPDSTLRHQAHTRMLGAYRPGVAPSPEAALGFYLNVTKQDPIQNPHIKRDTFLDAVRAKHGNIPYGFMDDRLKDLAKSVEGLPKAQQEQKVFDYIQNKHKKNPIPAGITVAELKKLEGMSDAQRQAYVKQKAGTVTLKDGTPIPWAALEAYQKGDKKPMMHALGVIGPSDEWKDGKPSTFFKVRDPAQVEREIQGSRAMQIVRMYQGLENHPAVADLKKTQGALLAMQNYGGRETLREMDRLTGGGRPQADRDISDEIRTRALAGIHAGLERIKSPSERAAAAQMFTAMPSADLLKLTPRMIAQKVVDQSLERSIDAGLKPQSTTLPEAGAGADEAKAEHRPADKRPAARPQ